MIDIIGAPFDLCGMRLGSRLGPDAVRLAGLEEELVACGRANRFAGHAHAPVDSGGLAEGGLAHFDALFASIVDLQRRVAESLEQGHMPLVLGGEHTIAVAGISAALQKTQGDLAVLWIDAHADINTPGSSETGNVHGMPLAALQGLSSETAGRQDEQWDQLLNLLGPTRLDPSRTAWYGLRDVDRGEVPRLKGLPITMHDIDRMGIVTTVEMIDGFLRQCGARNLWVSFDVDALDPILAPGTGTAVRGGLSYRESHLLAEILFEKLNAEDCPYRLFGLDVVETNPLYDSNNQTAKMVVEWVASLFGKTILGNRYTSRR